MSMSSAHPGDPLSTGPDTDSVEDNRAAIPLDGPTLGRVAIVTAQYFEDTEFFAPYYRFYEAHYDVDVLTPPGGPVTTAKGVVLYEGMSRIADATPSDYDLIYIPGGLRAPATLREDKVALDFIRAFVDTGRLTSSMCHGGRVLAAADVVNGKRVTGWRGTADELRAAGGIYVNEPAVEDGQFVTARQPSDIPRLLARLMARLNGAG